MDSKQASLQKRLGYQFSNETLLQTALTHHLVSKYTSLIAVDKTPVRPASDPLSTIDR